MLKLSKQEQDLFQRLATGSDGKLLLKFCEKLVNSLVDIRNIPDTDASIEKKARSISVRCIEEEFITRLKVLNGDIQSPEDDQYE